MFMWHMLEKTCKPYLFMDDLYKERQVKIKLSKDKETVLLVTNIPNERRIDYTTCRCIDLGSRLARFSREDITGGSIQVAIRL